jgi:hypothetical protein
MRCAQLTAINVTEGLLAAVFIVPFLTVHCAVTVPFLTVHCAVTVPCLTVHCALSLYKRVVTVPCLTVHCALCTVTV